MFWKNKETKKLEAATKLFTAVGMFLDNTKDFDRVKLHILYKSLKGKFFHGR